MALKSYGVMNISYTDESRTEDYLLEETEGATSFNIPPKLPMCGYMFPSEFTELIASETLAELKYLEETTLPEEGDEDE